MVCAGLENMTETGITGIMTFPTSCDYYFYAKIMGALFIILTMTLYYKDREKYMRGDLISAMGVSSIAVLFISLIGTLLHIIPGSVFTFMFAIGLVIISIWLIRER